MEKEVALTTAAKTITSVKVSSVGVVSSSGGIILGIENFNKVTIVLSIVALVISTIAFLYDHYHTEQDKKETGMKMATTYAMYLIFGTPALPAGYNFVVERYNDPMAGMIAGFFCSWVVVAVVKALKIRAVKKAEEGDI